MHSVKRLTQKNIDRGRHWLPFLNPRARDLIMLIPSLFCLSENMAGIYGHITCTPDQYDLLHHLLGRKPKIPVNQQPYRVLIESLIALPRPAVSRPGAINIVLLVVPKPGSDSSVLPEKCREIRGFFLDKEVALSPHILSGPFPPLILNEVMRTGVVLAGKHPLENTDEFPDFSFSAGKLPDYVTDCTSLGMNEWNPYQAYLEQQMEELVLQGRYHPYVHLTSVNPFFLPFLPILAKHEEEWDTEKTVAVRNCIDALFSRFAPTREDMKVLRKAWGIGDTPVSNPSDMTFAEAIRIRRDLIPLEGKELPLFSWPPPPWWELIRASLTYDGESWLIAEADCFRHRHAWVVLTWAALAGLIGPHTLVKAPRHLLLKRRPYEILRKVLQELLKGAGLIIPEDTHQGSVQMKSGRFFYSEAPFAALIPGKKSELSLFESIKKKALLDDSDLHPSLKK
jgi:hypothetical protein